MRFDVCATGVGWPRTLRLVGLVLAQGRVAGATKLDLYRRLNSWHVEFPKLLKEMEIKDGANK